MKKSLLVVALLTALNVQAYDTAFGQPLPPDCHWTYVKDAPTYTKASCLVPWLANAAQFWNWFNTRPTPTK